MLKEIVEKITSTVSGESKVDLLALDCQQKVEESYLLNNNLVESIYPQNDRMYDGDGNQWNEYIDGVANDRLANYSKLEHNFVADTVDRWTSFVGAQPPTIVVLPTARISVKNDVEPIEEDVEMEENEAEAVQKTIWRILRSNRFRGLFLTMAHLQSKYGRFIPYAYLTEGQHDPIIELMRPHDTMPVFDSRNYKTMMYCVGRTAFDVKKMEQKYGGTFAGDAFQEKIGDDVREKVYLYKILTENQLIFYGGKRVLSVIDHNYGRVPAFVCYNKVKPFSSEGRDDIRTIFRDQKAYNSTYSNIIDAVEDHVIGKRLIKKAGQATDMNALQDRHQRHVPIGPETEIVDLRPALPINESIEVLRLISSNIEDTTGITELLKGRFSGSIATGVALSGLSRGIQDIALTKIQNMSETLEEVINFCLFLLKKYRKTDPDGVSYSDILKRDYYYLDFFWDNTSIQDERIKATTKIDLVNSGIISRMTALKDLRYDYAEDEQTRVMYEKMHPMLNPELAMQIASNNIKKIGYDPDAEEFKAKSENAKLLRGQNVEVTETDPGQHMIHLSTHKEISSMVRGKARTAYEKHIADHNKQGKPAPTAPSPSWMSGSAPTPGMTGSPISGGVPGMGEQPPRPMAQPGIGNPQAL